MLTFGAVLCLLAVAVFILLYDRSKWFDDIVGQSIMALAGCLFLFPLSILVLLYLHTGAAVLLQTLALFGTAVVMVWLTVLMWQFNHAPGDSDGVETIDSSDEIGAV